MRTITQNYYISWLLLLTMSVVFFLSSCDNNPFDNKRFNQKVWLENPFNKGKDNDARLEMSEDLLKNHLKMGMTRQQVIKLLGKADWLDSKCSNPNDCQHYYLGEYTLSLFFDAGKLIKKEIVSI